MTDVYTVLEDLVNDYVSLMESGDAGDMHPENNAQIQAARAVLAHPKAMLVGLRATDGCFFQGRDVRGNICWGELPLLVKKEDALVIMTTNSIVCKVIEFSVIETGKKFKLSTILEEVT